MPYAVSWSIWKARNGVIFKGVTISKDDLLYQIMARIAFWIKAKYDLSGISVVDFKRCIQGIKSLKLNQLSFS